MPEYQRARYSKQARNLKLQSLKPVYLGMSILDISKIFMYEFWHDYIKPKYGNREKLCYVDTDSLVIHIVSEDFYENIANGLERWFDTSMIIMIKERFQ